MSADMLIRSVVTPLDVAGDGRTVIGMVCPYERPTLVDDGFGPFTEQVDRGAFARILERSEPRYVRLHLEHRGTWVGRGERWLDSRDGLSMSFRLDDTEPGRVAAFKLRDGQVPGLSVGMVPGRTRTVLGRDGPVEHRMTIKALHHVALVPEGAYPEAMVSAVRHRSADRLSAVQQWLETQ
jgi:HK97 family phage prohead protease